MQNNEHPTTIDLSLRQRVTASARGRLSFVVAAIFCVIPVLTGCGGKTDFSRGCESHLPVATVQTTTVEGKTQTNTEEIVGTVRAKTRASLEAKVSGRITTLPVVLGQLVRAGELVARLDAPEIVARRDQAEASLQQAGRDRKRMAELFEKRAVAEAEHEAADTRHRMAVGAAEEAKAMLSYVELVAPFDGVITKKWVEAGDLATPGKPLITIEASSELQLEADVPEALASQIRREARLTCRVDETCGEMTGVVREIAPNADPASRTVRVNLDLPPTAGLRSGQFVRLQVPIGENRSLRVPAAAMLLRGQLEIVFVAVNQSAQLRLVKAGRRFGNTVEILSGLNVGDSVVMDGADQLNDGQRLETK